jgi:transcriptional regulator of acetoin/glycerol metabolism
MKGANPMGNKIPWGRLAEIASASAPDDIDEQPATRRHGRISDIIADVIADDRVGQHNELAMILLLIKHPGISIRALSEMLGISKSTCHRQLKALRHGRMSGIRLPAKKGRVAA